MIKTECPKCKQETISLKQRLLANKWVDIYCDNCGIRLCTFPVGLALMSFILAWNIIFFGYLAISQESLTFGLLFIAGWIIIEFFMFYVPLSPLKPKQKSDTTTE